ncbi:hypothetical protein N656DRAFT_49459 [Canariomyces notabilis]|uniref:Pre-mRNA-splicing factor 38B n=1 Tax=Canariomyces notabilis TaxID=2074819 RepID=A0AAN6TP50_9PEZI|nr:hypothetical protein N656DRAFT_49459 [Canariomyces arenarius]
MDRNRAQYEILTDDAVAEILAKEASQASAKYSSMGLEAFRSAKPSNKAKPNTRFLGRIIKETTSHNAALLAKETAEAQARLDDLTGSEEKKRRKLNPSASDIRRRQLGDISSILQGRRRSSGAEGHSGSRVKKDSRRDAEELQKQDHRRKGGEDTDDEGHRSHRKKRGDGTKDEPGRRRPRSHSPPRRDRRYRDRSPLNSTDEDEQLHRSSKSRRKKSDRSNNDLIGAESSRRSRYGRLTADEAEMGSHTQPRRGDISKDPSASRPSRHDRSARIEEDDSSSDSDPLEDLIGPLPPSSSSSSSRLPPPVRTRGRGAIKSGATALDSRFAADYDPASELLEPEDNNNNNTDDWDEAVEAYRDRQKWKQQGADRLRAAGFTEEQIRKWEKSGSGGEKDIEDVRWSKAGEKREWYVQCHPIDCAACFTIGAEDKTDLLLPGIGARMVSVPDYLSRPALY